MTPPMAVRRKHTVQSPSEWDGQTDKRTDRSIVNESKVARLHFTAAAITQDTALGGAHTSAITVKQHTVTPTLTDSPYNFLKYDQVLFGLSPTYSPNFIEIHP